MKSIKFIIFFLIITGLYSCKNNTDNQKDTTSRIENLIAQMTLKEKINMLGGTGFDTPSIKRLKIPALKMTDGPAGVRLGNATAFPAPVALAASWDNDLVYRVGKAMAQEVLSKNKNVLLAPCVNIHRFPLGGRNFESYGEDPFLSARTAVPFIKGVQSEGVVATVKHFAVNNQEWERLNINAVVDERTLREIYLPAFKAAVQKANVYSVMAAYNKVNGHYCSANKHLLTDILKNEWGFKGYVVSDWGATHNTTAAANAGLDIEMPYAKHFGDSLLSAVKAGKVSETTINDKVRRILRVMFKAGLFDRKTTVTNDSSLMQLHKNLALETAEKSIVLLKNDNNILPLDIQQIKTIAVIGPNAAYAVSGGGGSSMVRPKYKISPLQGIKNYAGNDIKILYAPGQAIDGDILPVESKYLFRDNDKKNGLKAEYFSTDDFNKKPVFSRIDKTINFNFGYNAPEPVMDTYDDGNRYAIRWTGFVKAPKSGIYTLKLQSDGGIRLFVDDKCILDDWDNKQRVKLRTVKVKFNSGTYHKLKIEYVSWWSVSEIKFGWDIPGIDPVQEAINIASNADITILVTGLNNHFESESGDLPRFYYPKQNAFINKIAMACKNTVVVMYNGSAYGIANWANNVPAIVEAWYSGQEQGNALANVLFGKTNPSGKLPFTFIRDSADCPAFANYKKSIKNTPFSEQILVGYRYYDTKNIPVVFPFGYGLSYTTFDYQNLIVEKQNPGKVTVSFTLKNTGTRTGSETVQLYVNDEKCSVLRPEKELKEFKKVTLPAGKQTTVNFTLTKDAFSFYDVKTKKWKMEPGKFKILIGSSSRDIKLKKEIDFE